MEGVVLEIVYTSALTRDDLPTTDEYCYPNEIAQQQSYEYSIYGRRRIRRGGVFIRSNPY